MNLLQIFVTTGAISIVAVIIGLFILNKTKTITSDEPSYTQEEITNIKLAEELYNKELRNTSADITPQVIEKAVEIAKVLPPDTTINAEVVVEKAKQTKSEFPIDKPKKKRKYYPRKPKTQS